MTCTLLDLIPYAYTKTLVTRAEKVRILRVVVFICNTVNSASVNFSARHFEAFDAQVSDNLCQIRAYYLAQLTDKQYREMLKCFEALSDRAAQVKVKATQLLASYANPDATHSKSKDKTSSNPADFIWEMALNIYIEEPCFLLICHLLSTYKTQIDFETFRGIDYGKLSYDTHIESKTFLRKLVHELQRIATVISCKHVKTWCSETTKNNMITLLDFLQEQDEVGRYILPCYEVTKTILEHASLMNFPIQLRFTQLSHNGAVLADYQVVTTADPTSGKYDQPNELYPVDGTSLLTFSWSITSDLPIDLPTYLADLFKRISAYDLIMSHMAQHPQYPGKLFSEITENPYVDKPGLFNHNVDMHDMNDREMQFLQHKRLASSLTQGDQGELFPNLRHVKAELFSSSNCHMSPGDVTMATMEAG